MFRKSSYLPLFLFVFYLSFYHFSSASKIIDDYNTSPAFFCKDSNCKNGKVTYTKKLKVENEVEVYKISKKDGEESESYQDSTIEDSANEDEDSNNEKGFFDKDKIKNGLKKFKDETLYKSNLSGFYFNGGLSMPLRYSISGDRHASGYDSNAGHYPQNSQGLSFYLGAGFNQALPYNLLLGLELFYMEPHFNTLSKWNISGVNIGGTSSSSQIDMNTKTSLNRSFGVKLRGGFYLWRILFFGTIGYSYNMLSDNNYSVNSNLSQNNQIGAHGLVYGGGIELYMTNFLFFRLEYTETFFSYKMKFDNIYSVSSSGALGNNLVLSNSMRFGTLLFTAGFKFTIGL